MSRHFFAAGVITLMLVEYAVLEVYFLARENKTYPQCYGISKPWAREELGRCLDLLTCAWSKI